MISGPDERPHELLKKVLAFSTVNGEGHERALAGYLKDYFSFHGIQAEVDGSNVAARIAGKDHGHLLVLNGHLDTVPYGDLSKWNTDPSVPVEKDGKIYARGASDMKSGLCAMVSALCSIMESHIQPRRDILFLGTADEEKNGTGASLAFEEKLCSAAELVLIGEPTGCAVGLAQKGCLWLECTVCGKTSHGAYPEEGINAVDAAFAFSAELKTYIETFTHPLLGTSTVSLDLIRGGVAYNMVPDVCTAGLDIRMVPSLTEEMVLEYADKVVLRMEKCTPGLSVRLSVMNSRRAVETVPDNKDAVSLRSCIQSVAGSVPADTGINFFTDASILVKDRPDIPVILFGPGYQQLAHKPDEYVEWKMYDTAVGVYKEFIIK